MDQFVLGALMMGSALAGLFFLRFWRETGDRLFASFAAAFWLLGLTRFYMALFGEVSEGHTFVYLLRLLAFVLMLAAIIDKNRSQKDRG